MPTRTTRSALLWTLAPLLSLGLLTVVPFVRKSRPRRGWELPIAAVVSLAAVLGFAAGDEDAGTTLLVLAWLGGTVYVAAALLTGAPGGDASDRALDDARTRESRRRKARELVEKDPAVARELGIGRPDLDLPYDDGGLIDVNTAPAPVLARHLSWTPEETQSVLDARARLGRFAGSLELIAYTDIAPPRVDAARPVLVFS
ncbi:hypothetical protein G5C51_27775 [Streptomyces sp. A7024]|uniref:Uncharacterized protein n=1 Tax=Streptomyces coryli TaxID=1128680 RepID=A0A6G4U8Q8_9ACTN|nr:hypothetical protein [Streptomyces coryli]NGN67687.1 hypothetical protein [Streptomyces coryli]